MSSRKYASKCANVISTTFRYFYQGPTAWATKPKSSIYETETCTQTHLHTTPPPAHWALLRQGSSHLSCGGNQPVPPLIMHLPLPPPQSAHSCAFSVLFVHAGFRFSRKALMPSWPSRRARLSTMTREAVA